MDTGLGVAARIHARVQVNLILVTALVIIVMLVVIGVFLVAKSNRPSTLTRSEAAQRRPALGSATVVASQATAPGDDNAADVDKLLARAGSATRQQKYLTPPGNSAFELYLRVLRLQRKRPVTTPSTAFAYLLRCTPVHCGAKAWVRRLISGRGIWIRGVTAA